MISESFMPAQHSVPSVKHGWHALLNGDLDLDFHSSHNSSKSHTAGRSLHTQARARSRRGQRCTCQSPLACNRTCTRAVLSAALSLLSCGPAGGMHPQ